VDRTVLPTTRKLQGGVWKPIFDASNVKAVNGLDIQTTLDINLQDVAETALHKAMAEHDAADGLVVVMEVKTGAIKAISNLSSDGKGITMKDSISLWGNYSSRAQHLSWLQ
jgi:cell division protein FtsI (penicillin-binding protein 3)